MGHRRGTSGRSRSASRRLPVTLATAALATVLLAPSVAAATEHQWHAGLGLGWGVVDDAGALNGFGGGLHLTYGLTDAFNALLHVDVTAHPGGDVLVGGAALGAAYVIDILEWVPYVGLTAGAYDLISVADACGTAAVPPAPAAVECHRFRFGAAVPLGVDYLISRSFAVGAQGRFHLLFGDGSPGLYITAMARAEYIWGY